MTKARWQGEVAPGFSLAETAAQSGPPAKRFIGL
jgi:hypothetical protein